LGEIYKEGKILKGRYEIIKTLEETQDGMVYLAKDKQSQGTLIHLREIRTKLKSSQKTRVELAQKEAQILSVLNHQGIPKYIDFFTGVDSHFLATEYVEGDYLDALLKGRGAPFGFDEVQPWAVQLCDILKYLHTQEKPVIVRGIQPSSLLLTYKGELKLVNFGMARQFDEVKTIDTVFVWNPGYTSPEQYGKQKSDNRSDIYSFGATFYNLLTNQDVGAMNFNFPPISQFNGKVPPRAEEVIMKCLAINPDDRYQTIFEVKSALLTWQQGSASSGAAKKEQRGGQQKQGTSSVQKESFFSKIFSMFKKN
jgi:eukaryotic-like serine/threonine-protein kinase